MIRKARMDRSRGMTWCRQSIIPVGACVIEPPMSNRVKMVMILVGAAIALGLVFYVRARLLAV